MDNEEKIKKAEKETNTNPSEKQKESGRYKKGKVTIKGFKISIENPVGSERTGVDTDGNSWKTKMKNTYGFFNGTIGKDGDPIDLFLGPLVNEDFDVFIIDQVDPKTKIFDEHKVMFGFENEEKAKKAYFVNYEKNWEGFGSVTKISLEKFSNWINNDKLIKFPASKLNNTNKMAEVIPEEKILAIELEGEVIEGKTLLGLQEQASKEEFDVLLVNIASPGGSVAEGLEIMIWLDSLSRSGKHIVTVVTANAYSIASLIMLVADFRIISTHGEVMVHNPMVPELTYVNASELELYAKELRNLEDMMYDLYGTFTGLEKEKIKTLMDSESYLSPEDAVKLGFADLVVDMDKRPFSTAANDVKITNMSKMINVLNRVISMVSQAEITNQLYYSEAGTEVEIYQKSPASYAIGDRTSQEDGKVKLADGAVVDIKNYIIVDIDKVGAKAGDFNEGEGPKKEEAKADPEKKEDKPVDEFPPKEKEEEEKPVDEFPPKEEEEEKPVDAEDPEKEEEEAAPTIDDLIASLEARITSLEEEKQKMTAKLEAMAAFEEKATEAIDVLASNTVTKFTPEAKGDSVVEPTGSIFSRLKQKRGL